MTGVLSLTFANLARIAAEYGSDEARRVWDAALAANGRRVSARYANTPRQLNPQPPDAPVPEWTGYSEAGWLRHIEENL